MDRKFGLISRHASKISNTISRAREGGGKNDAPFLACFQTVSKQRDAIFCFFLVSLRGEPRGLSTMNAPHSTRQRPGNSLFPGQKSIFQVQYV